MRVDTVYADEGEVVGVALVGDVRAGPRWDVSLVVCWRRGREKWRNEGVSLVNDIANGVLLHPCASFVAVKGSCAGNIKGVVTIVRAWSVASVECGCQQLGCGC